MSTIQKKIIGLFASIRVLNLVLIVLAQYLSSVYIFSVEESLFKIITDPHLFYIVLATICVVSAGYIINDFYDEKEDIVNRPHKFEATKHLSLESKLKSYFTLNILGVLIALGVSIKSALFFSTYIFLIWIYSHKLKKLVLIKDLIYSLLSILPFFVLFVYYKNISWFILTHGVFLFLAFYTNTLVKDLQNQTTSILKNRASISVSLGEKTTKFFILIILTSLIPISLYLTSFEEIGMMKFYFYGILGSIPIFITLLFLAVKTKDFYILHNLIRIGLFFGVISITLIDSSIILSRLLKL